MASPYRKYEVIGETVWESEKNRLTVVAIDHSINTKGAWCRRHILECSVCSKDEELWPLGSITAILHDVRNGKSPCGCSKRPMWTEDQNIIRVKRKCRELGLTFKGWKGQYKGHKTKTLLENSNTGQILPILPSLLGVLQRDRPYKEDITRADSEIIEKFLQNEKFKGYSFKRSDKRDTRGSKVYWEVTCPVCREDKFVKNKLCSGVFQATTSSLNSGWLPCRCGDSHNLSLEQKRFVIENLLTEEGSGVFPIGKR